MLVGCVFNFYTSSLERADEDGVLTHDERIKIDKTRMIWLPTYHACMCLITLINSPTLNLEGLKAAASFVGMILSVNVMQLVTSSMIYFP
jgi:hypothetical protein